MGAGKTQPNQLQEIIKTELYSLLEEQGIDPSSVPGIEQKAMRAVAQSPAPSQEPVSEKPKKKARVIFDKDTDNPYSVTFSERGFDVDGTRLNFDLLKYAISKDFHIKLSGGEGLELTPVKMQKILKYEDRF